MKVAPKRQRILFTALESHGDYPRNGYRVRCECGEVIDVNPDMPVVYCPECSNILVGELHHDRKPD